MNIRFLRLITLAISLFVIPLQVKGNITLPSDEEDRVIDSQVDIFLIISSFNPNTKRTIGFIDDFSERLALSYPHEHHILIEDLAARNFGDDAHNWKRRVESLMGKYKNQDLKAVITIGQEAWAALISLDSLYHNIPILAAFVSSNGINLPTRRIDSSWTPTWISSAYKACKLSYAGGTLVYYNVSKNIELIQMLFPETQNVVLITDNTYGGISIKTHFKRAINRLPTLNYQFLDSRELYIDEIKERLRELPKNTAILMGTWMVNKDGQYYTENSLKELLQVRRDLPAFSLTGSGMGMGVIGGYMPQYNLGAYVIADQIIEYQKGNRDSLHFNIDANWYNFDNQKIKEFNLNKNSLPISDFPINIVDTRVEQYRSYLVITSFIALILLFFMSTLFILYYKNRKLRESLEKQSNELLRAKEQAEESNQLKSSFLANMSHEIRTPLNAIVGFSNLLIEPNFPEEEKSNVSKIISDNSDLLLTLITDILDISSLESGKLNFLYKEINLYQVCTQVLETIEHLKKPNIKYSVETKEKDLVIVTDAHRLSQVLINLVTNANKFTEEGSVMIGYKRVKKEDVEMLLFCVTDTGCGILKDKHDEIFERFEKLDHFKQGAGLGLAISKQIITYFGGRIWIDANYKKGAKICFTHPLDLQL